MNIFKSMNCDEQSDWSTAIKVIGGVRRHSVLVLLLPGMTGNLRQWDCVRSLLRDAPADLAFGTPALPGPVFGEVIPTVTDAARAISAELRTAQDDKVIIVSHSVGSFSALAVAHEIPSAVKSVILVNGGLAGVGRFLDRPAGEFISHPLRCVGFLLLFIVVSAPAPAWLKRIMTGQKWLLRVLLGWLASGSAVETPEKRAALVNEAGGPWILRSLWENRHYWRKFEAYSHEITPEVLFVIGDGDPISTERDAEAMAADLPHAKIRVVKGVKHAAPLEAPEEIADIVRHAIKFD